MQSPWFSVAMHFKGLTEVHGSVDNPKIVEMFRISGHPEVKDDETPWCAAFVGVCLRLSGYRSSGSLGARSYQNFGEDLKNAPQRGCIVVFTRGSPKASTGHVAFYDHDDGDHVIVLGGNQGDAVTMASFPKSRVLTYRLPTETAPLPTDTTLPNILTIDAGSAPPHVLGIGAATTATIGPREVRATEILSEGTSGPRVRALQEALARSGFQPGEIDGEYGPLTAFAVSNFQGTRRLPVTGNADADTLRHLGLFVSDPTLPVIPTIPSVPGVIAADGGATMQPQDILKPLFEVLAARRHQPALAPGSVPSDAAGVDTSQLLQIALAALSGKQLAPAPESPTGTAPAVMSPIDKVLGGEALQGKKTPLAILAYAILAILQAVDVAGTATGPTATPTGQILTTLIGSLGGLGLLGKFDRVVQMLGIMAAKAPSALK
ncbi:TIGR02594 family protein [Bradyrhizobium sp. CSS354]|uniref:C40 family peptidase n=1 Tax=Bradyrhizobium sp. CSS354 TaxID=2699172 RepID=UPI0023B10E75|nr:TIGR02594 family protein [Bradyrhizobium sp. CSS354]MDE5461333.1 TIGR02594 family protein [Bradyrhizobium sp. CSS354]